MKKIFLFSLFLFSLIASEAAALEVTSLYPTLGKLGDPLTISMTGSGFDASTRVMMYLDTDNVRASIGALTSPVTNANGLTMVDQYVFLADGVNGLRIIDITNPSFPVLVGTADTPGDAKDVFVVDNRAYVADYNGGLQVVDISNLAQPTILGAIDTSGDAYNVFVVDGIAYVADWNGGLQIIDVSNPSSPSPISSFDISGAVYDVEVVGSLAYVSGWSTGKFVIIDVSTPSTPSLVGTAYLSSSWLRDVTIAGSLAFIAADSSRGLQVVDISNPAAPKVIGSDFPIDGAMSVAVSGNRAYLAGGIHGLQILDVSNPASPALIGQVGSPGSVFEVEVYGDIAYLADYNGGLQVVDVSSPEPPTFLGSASISTPQSLTISGTTAYIANHGAGILTMDITDPTSPTILATLDTPGVAQHVELAGNLLYVADQVIGGLQIIDVSTPSSPVIVGSIDTPGSAKKVKIAGSLAYVADVDGGLQIIDISEPTSPAIIGSIDTPGSAWDVSIQDNLAYVADWENGLQIVDISNPAAPSIIGSVDTPGHATSIEVVGNKAYVADWSTGLQIIDINDPANPAILGAADTPGSSGAKELAIDGSIAYVINPDTGLHFIDIADPANPRLVYSLHTPGYKTDFQVNGNLLYIADEDIGLQVVPLPVEKTPTVNSSASITLSLASPPLASHYVMQVYNSSQTLAISSAVSFLEPDDWAVQNKKKAIIVAGGGPYTGNTLWTATKLSANYAYNSLLSQGYSRENIYYLNPESSTDADGDGAYNDVDGPADFQSLSESLTSWATDATEVLLYLTDHGGSSTFQLNSERILTAAELDQLLDTLQNSISGKVIVIYDACQSGSFIPELTPLSGREHDRVVITSSKADETAKFINNGVMSFSYQFWSYLRTDARLLKAMTAGKLMMEQEQTVLVEANGNGIANEAEDYAMAQAVTICRGRVISRTPPEIGTVNGEIVLSSGNFATIWAKDVTAANGLDKITAIINPPGYEDAPLDIPVTDYPTIELVGPDGEGKYSAVYDGFVRNGTYEISIMASDKDGLYSLPQKTRVVQQAGSTAPLAIATPGGGQYNKAQTVRLIPSEQNSKIYYSLTGTATKSSTEYTEAISISTDTTISFLAVSATGEAGPVSTAVYLVDVFPPVTPAIDQNKNPSSSWSPYPEFTWGTVSDADHYILQYADNNLFDNAVEKNGLKANNYIIPEPLPRYGRWYWRVAAVDGAGNQGNWGQYQYEYIEDTKLHKAIIVAGGDPDQGAQTWQATKAIVQQAYEVLEYQGFSAEKIKLLSADSALDIDGDGSSSEVDGGSTKINLQESIVTWAGDADDLIIFIAGAGTETGYSLSISETLSPLELDSWLDELQTSMTGKVTVIYDADYSGNIVKSLLPPAGRQRVVISSATDKEKAMFLHGGILSFSYQFWSSVFYNGELYDSFVNGKRMVKANQNALIDANSNGEANEKSDMLASQGFIIGQGRKAASTAPEIGSVSFPEISGTSSAEIWAKDVSGLNEISRVFVLIASISGKDETVVLSEFTSLDLTYNSIDTYKANFNGFSQAGLYLLNFYAVDSNGLYSLPKYGMLARDVLLPKEADENFDGNIDNIDVSLILQIMVDQNKSGYTSKSVDVNDDGLIGIQEVLDALRKMTGTAPP